MLLHTAATHENTRQEQGKHITADRQGCQHNAMLGYSTDGPTADVECMPLTTSLAENLTDEVNKETIG
jgi:hypothetical protein